MNKNKIIFAILGILLLVGILYGAFTLSQAGKTQDVKKVSSGDMRIWVLEDDATKFTEYLKKLSETSENLKGKNFIVESFDDYYLYKQAFFSALLSGEAPDIFMIPSSEESLLEKQVLALDSTLLSPNDFRKNFKGIFGDDLILSDGEEVKKEYLKGIVMGYESLGVYYNRRYFNAEDFASWTSLSSVLTQIKEKDENIIPLGMGNGSSVEQSSDIFTALLVLFGAKDISSIETQMLSQALELYLSFGKTAGDNAYDSISFSGDMKTNLDHFAEGTVGAIIGTPHMLQKIDAKGYKKQFLLASQFPESVGEEKKMWVQYNTFVINAASQKQDIAQELLALMTTEPAQKSYLESFPYYLPALLSLESEMMEQKIHPNYNIVYKDFLNLTAIPVSFKTGDLVLYKTLMTSVLDSGESAENVFVSAKAKLICASAKILTLTNLSSTCE